MTCYHHHRAYNREVCRSIGLLGFVVLCPSRECHHPKLVLTHEVLVNSIIQIQIPRLVLIEYSQDSEGLGDARNSI